MAALFFSSACLRSIPNGLRPVQTERGVHVHVSGRTTFQANRTSSQRNEGKLVVRSQRMSTDILGLHARQVQIWVKKKGRKNLLGSTSSDQLFQFLGVHPREPGQDPVPERKRMSAQKNQPRTTSGSTIRMESVVGSLTA